MASDATEQAASADVRQAPRVYTIRDRRFLRLKRESRNLSQADLAKFIGVSRSAVTHWESGANVGVSPEHGELVAIILDEPLHALFVVD
jgi:transcriptional regulator with XRE-family HTH domain